MVISMVSTANLLMVVTENPARSILRWPWTLQPFPTAGSKEPVKEKEARQRGALDDEDGLVTGW